MAAVMGGGRLPHTLTQHTHTNTPAHALHTHGGTLLTMFVRCTVTPACGKRLRPALIAPALLSHIVDML